MGTHTFRANDDLSRAIDDRCLAENINKSELIIRAIEQYLASVIQPVIQPVIQTDIDDRFRALEGEIETIKKQLKAIVESGKTPPKTEPKAPQKTKTIALGEGTIANVRIDWKSFIAEFPGKNLDELEEIAVQRYPEKKARRMRDSIGRRLKAKVKGKEA